MYHKDVSLSSPVARYIQEKDMVVCDSHDRVVTVGLEIGLIDFLPLERVRFSRDLV